ncbi:MAG TPA: ORF6N domain-containing protein [Coxiellaceae bacterium]|nr:MAG: DNA-binding protein [Gammaproteobacteria bacterium RIFCSPHIGHO2_12_FULL_36_30]HLB55711.1 ORF6N domain-containing protein [Coxiellaceae bacterium]
MNQITFADIQSKIFNMREQEVIIDSDVAELYSVSTKHINQAVKRNQRRFPEGYILPLENHEWELMKSQFVTSPVLGGGKVKIPNAFTEKGLYMLATILKSDQAIETTIAIIEAYSKLRDLSKNIKQLSSANDEQQKKGFLQKSGEIITNLLDKDAFSNESETTIELNFAVLKLKHVVKKNTQH